MPSKTISPLVLLLDASLNEDIVLLFFTSMKYMSDLNILKLLNTDRRQFNFV